MANTTSRAFLNWLVYVGIFLLFGGLGAGVITLLYQGIIGEPFSEVLYAVIFGGSGFIAYHAFRDARPS